MHIKVRYQKIGWNRREPVRFEKKVDDGRTDDGQLDIREAPLTMSAVELKSEGILQIDLSSMLSWFLTWVISPKVVYISNKTFQALIKIPNVVIVEISTDVLILVGNCFTINLYFCWDSFSVCVYFAGLQTQSV